MSRLRQRLPAIGAVLGLAALAAAVVLLPVRGPLAAFLDAVGSLGAWAPVVIGLSYIPASVLLLPGSVLTLGAGFVAGLPAGFVAVSLGSTAGATVAFVLGRTVARGWVESKIASRPAFAAVQEAVGREGFKIVFLLRLSPLFPFNFLNYALGVTRVSLRDYVLASWLGMIPGTLMYVYFGSAAHSLAAIVAGEVEGGVAGTVLFGVGLLATVAVTVLVTRSARRALAESVGRVPEPATEVQPV